MINWKDFNMKVESYARYLCERDGVDPDSFYEEFNREAAFWGQDDEYVFPKTYYWQEYEQEAWRAVSYFFGEPENDE